MARNLVHSLRSNPDSGNIRVTRHIKIFGSGYLFGYDEHFLPFCVGGKCSVRI
jgi:hypothetical protein